ncbi:glycoside hydrolase family 61 protein [Amanita muscaria]
MKFSTTLALLSSLILTTLAPTVSAHGFVHQVIIDGTSYIGNPPNAAQNTSPLRQVSDVGPVKGATNPNVNCGLDAQLASQVANANPGSIIQWDWRGGDLSHWPHNTGPMMTYMASCGSTTCDQFNSSNAKWFLIDRVGQSSDGSWAQADLMTGALASVKVPSSLAPGNYIMRHEIIALHLAVTLGGAEFYPGCAQLSIGGSQTGVPQPSDLVSLPGAYKDTDPGIFDPNVFDSGATYTFPGPPIASFISGASSSGNGTSSGSGPSSSGNSTSSNPGSSGGSSSGSGSGSGSCRLRRKSASSSSSTPNTTSSSSSSSGYRKRALMFHRQTRNPTSLSRIMRDVFLGDQEQQRRGTGTL